MAGDEPVPSELLRLAETPVLRIVTSPARGQSVRCSSVIEPAPGAVTLAFCFVAALACLATALCRAAAPPVHRRAACFVCCIVSLLFVPYLLFASGEPAASFLHVDSRSPLSHTFHEHSRVARPPNSLLPTDATRTAFEPFLWCHPRKQNGHTRHLVATKVGAVVFATSGRECERTINSHQPTSTP